MGGRVGVEEMVVMVSGRWGVFWNLEVETGGKSWLGRGGGFLLKTERYEARLGSQSLRTLI